VGSVCGAVCGSTGDCSCRVLRAMRGASPTISLRPSCCYVYRTRLLTCRQHSSPLAPLHALSPMHACAHECLRPDCLKQPPPPTHTQVRRHRVSARHRACRPRRYSLLPHCRPIARVHHRPGHAAAPGGVQREVWRPGGSGPGRRGGWGACGLAVGVCMLVCNGGAPGCLPAYLPATI